MRDWRMWLQAFVDLIVMAIVLCVLIVAITLLFGTEKQANDLGLLFLSVRRSLGL
jgi:uncharacterized membrane protein